MVLSSLSRKTLTGIAFGALVLTGAGCRSNAPRTADPVVPAGTAEVTSAPTTSPSGTTPTAVRVLGVCEHPYYPLRQGYQAEYRVNSPSFGTATKNYSMRVTSADATSVNLRSTFASEAPGQPPITADQVINCTNGGLQARSYVDLGSRLMGGAAANQFNIETRNATGELLPRDVAVGSRWEGGFNIHMDPVAAGIDNPAMRGIDLAVTIRRHAVAEEQVSVPAGQYTALKIEAVTDVGGVSSITGTEWWVRGVGMVKSTYDLGTGSQTTVTEALSVTVPS